MCIRLYLILIVINIGYYISFLYLKKSKMKKNLTSLANRCVYSRLVGALAQHPLESHIAGDKGRAHTSRLAQPAEWT